MLKDTNFFPKQSLEIYEKLKTADENGQLGVANRRQAINFAKNNGIIS